MSDFFRISVPPEIAAAGIKTLARLAHEAEETDDDVLLMQVSAVVEHRDYGNIFREEYIRQWHERMKARNHKEQRT